MLYVKIVVEVRPIDAMGLSHVILGFNDEGLGTSLNPWPFHNPIHIELHLRRIEVQYRVGLKIDDCPIKLSLRPSIFNPVLNFNIRY